MAIPYNGNIPQATDIPAQSQSQILTNFGSIQAIIDVNHADFGMATAGQHNYVQMPVQASAPAVNVGDVGLYNLLSGGNNQMFLRKSDGTSVPITKGNLATPGYSYLPSGILVQWALVTVAGGSNPQTVTYPLAYTTAVYNVQITMYASSGAPATDPNTFSYVLQGSLTTTTFQVVTYKRDQHQTVVSTNPIIIMYTAWGV